MILWLNGAFGVGKTTTAGIITRDSPGFRPFDPEWVGYMLRANLTDLDLADFQDLRSWRALVPKVAREIIDVTNASLVAVQTVLVEQYWHEIREGMADVGLEVVHVLLDADADVIRERIDRDEVDPGARAWRLDHLEAYEAARTWMRADADLVVNTTEVTADQAAAEILQACKEWY
jgi:hypothetical protein